MSIGLAFWILMLLWLVGGFVWHGPGVMSGQYWPLGSNLLLFVLLVLLGWHAFGAPLRG